MSLQLAAQHLSSQGRGKDSTLVHMSPREVKGLNDLAMAHGGQLSINPQTGLPEAGFLESILPMVAGAGLMAVSGGTINPMTAGLITGGLGFAMTGSLQKGLMAGLGAYGGANLGTGLMENAVTMDPSVVQAKNAVVENATKNLYDPTGTLSPEAYASTKQAANNTLAESLKTARATAAGPDTFMGNLQQMGKGISSLGKEGGFSSLYQNLGGSPMSLLKSVGSAAAPAIGEAMKPKEQEEEKADADMGQRYGFSMNPTGGQPQQPRQVQPGQNPLDNPQTPTTTPFPQPDPYGREQRYFAPSYSKLTPEQAKTMYGYADGGITGQGGLQLNIPLDIGGGGSYGGGGNGGGTYPFQSSGGFAGYNNAPQVTSNPSLVADQAQRMQPFSGSSNPSLVSATRGLGATQFPSIGDSGLEFQGPLLAGGSMGQFPYAAGGPRPEGLGSLFNAQKMADGGVATDPDRPTETPALKMFQQMQAQRAAQPQPAQIDANAEFAKYAQQAIGAPNQLQAPPTAPATSTGLGEYGYSYNPVKQQLTQIPGTAPAEPSANPFSIDGRPVVAYTATGEKIYGEKPDNRPIGMGGIRMASGGISHLGDYSDGGRLLRGPGDGVSDSIPAMIGKRQPARLADGEFVVPARIVSELGNGSTEAGARKLYAMMDRIQKARGKTVGKGKVAKNSRSEKYLPA
jgi:hypothetical protein